MCLLCEIGISPKIPRCSYQEYTEPETIGDPEIAHMYESQGNLIMSEIHRLSRTRARAIIMWIARQEPDLLIQAITYTQPAEGIMDGAVGSR